MDLNSAVSLVTLFLIALLLVTVLLENPRNRINLFFAALSFAVALWIGNNVLADHVQSYALALFLTRASILWSALLPLLFNELVFSLYFQSDTASRKIIRGVRVVSLSTIGSMLLLSGTTLNIRNITQGVAGVEYQPGVLYYVLFAYFLAVFGYAFMKLVQVLRTSRDARKAQAQFMLLGTLVSVVMGVLTNIVLPLAGYSWVNVFGPPAVLFFVGFTALAILRHHLFAIKVIVTELLVFVLWTFILLRTLLSETSTDIYANGALFAITVVTGVFLIKSVIREVQGREEIQRLYKELEVKNEKLTELDKLKSQFLSITTHELSTPLTIVRNFISLMLDGSYGIVPPAAEEAGRQVFERVTDMAHSVDTYLNVSRIEQGKISYSFAHTDLSHIVTLAVQGLKANAEKKKLSLSLTVKPGAEALHGNYDAPKITEVVINLVDNSIKYTPQGSVHVTLEKVGQRARVTIQDTGVGMTEKTKAGLFKLFSPGEDSKKINPASTGVGLYVTKAHVDAHKGSLTAHSDGPGKGSTFVLELPLV